MARLTFLEIQATLNAHGLDVEKYRSFGYRINGLYVVKTLQDCLDYRDNQLNGATCDLPIKEEEENYNIPNEYVIEESKEESLRVDLEGLNAGIRYGGAMQNVSVGLLDGFNFSGRYEGDLLEVINEQSIFPVNTLENINGGWSCTLELTGYVFHRYTSDKIYIYSPTGYGEFDIYYKHKEEEENYNIPELDPRYDGKFWNVESIGMSYQEDYTPLEWYEKLIKTGRDKHAEWWLNQHPEIKNVEVREYAFNEVREYAESAGYELLKPNNVDEKFMLIYPGCNEDKMFLTSSLNEIMEVMKDGRFLNNWSEKTNLTLNFKEEFKNYALNAGYNLEIVGNYFKISLLINPNVYGHYAGISQAMDAIKDGRMLNKEFCALPEITEVKILTKTVSINPDVHYDIKLTHDPVFRWQLIGADLQVLREPLNPQTKEQPTLKFKTQISASIFAKRVMAKVKEIKEANSNGLPPEGRLKIKM